jgi:hypothetical protein
VCGREKGSLLSGCLKEDCRKLVGVSKILTSQEKDLYAFVCSPAVSRATGNGSLSASWEVHCSSFHASL